MNQTLLYSLLVVVLWGLVPSFAKMGNMSGGMTTMYVNWFATIGVFLIMSLTGAKKEFKNSQPYLKLVLIGLVWPLLYSICYFTSIQIGSSSMTTITNYSWPVFYLLMATIVGKKFPAKNWAIIIAAAAAVMVPTMMGGGIKVTTEAVMLGLIAACCQAFFSLVSERLHTDDWLVIFVVSLVTTIGSTIYVVVNEGFSLPDTSSLLYAAMIGVLSNGVGFWAFLRASKLSEKENHKSLFLVLMCTTPIAQVLLLVLLGVERVGFGTWFGVALITGALIAYRLYGSKPATA